MISRGDKRILRPMAIAEDGASLTLRQVLDWAHAESLRERRRKTNISHELAHKFMVILREAGTRILDEGKDNANYFVLEVDGKTVAVSPFGSHEEWWEKPSEGFRSMATKLGCDWGVVLFLLSEHEGLWIEGLDFDSTVLKGKEKVNSGDVRQARWKGLARQFSKASDFLRLVKTPVPRSGKPFLVRKPARD